MGLRKVVHLQPGSPASSEEAVDVFTLICPRCCAEVSLPAHRLLVRVEAGATGSGEVLFTCLGCHECASVSVDPAAVVALVTGGVTYLSMSPPVVEHPEVRPGGPAFTTDDLLDLHTELDGGGWFDEQVGPGY